MKLRHKLQCRVAEAYSATVLLKQVLQLELYLHVYVVKAVHPRYRLASRLNNLQSVHLYLLLALIQFQVF